MDKFLKLTYSIHISWVAEQYQLMCTVDHPEWFKTTPYYVYNGVGSANQIKWEFDLGVARQTPWRLHDTQILYPNYRSPETYGLFFFDGVCRANGQNTYLRSFTTPNVYDTVNVYPIAHSSLIPCIFYSPAEVDNRFVMVDANTNRQFLECWFVMTNQRILTQREIDTIWGDHDTLLVTHTFAFRDGEDAEYEAFVNTFGDRIIEYKSANFTWQIDNGYLPELVGCDRVIPPALPTPICKLYIGNNPVRDLFIGDEPVISAYFRDDLIWNKEV